ncbi:eukaryotic peptide chain release factor GTP-binding subunit ERF3B isoform X1 [Gossypium hirsutum]|uniref:Dynein light chain 1, cytoplasmic n=1 Tax=Gossypium hirsutum TaxID=3635 RepID=A0A1U8MZ70_GOSHI|nr:eukaryotic peptide chain release factor GTP-binding subunit ERF3B-like isoform X1 [Gossypium hirsutum]
MSTEAAKRSTTGALMMKQRKTDELKPSPALTAEPKKVIIKSADMKDDMQKKAVNIAISAFEKNNVEKDVAEYIKKDFNKKHGPTWHCIVGRNFDAGKSTTGGQILFLSGQIDDLTIQKYEKEAKDKSRESWYMAYIMDTNEEERVKGKTVEVGRAHFETEITRFTILDAPGILCIGFLKCSRQQKEITREQAVQAQEWFNLKMLPCTHSHPLYIFRCFLQVGY